MFHWQVHKWLSCVICSTDKYTTDYLVIFDLLAIRQVTMMSYMFFVKYTSDYYVWYVICANRPTQATFISYMSYWQVQVTISRMSDMFYWQVHMRLSCVSWSTDYFVIFDLLAIRQMTIVLIVSVIWQYETLRFI